ncbi:MAG: hypothetical protein A3A22_02080 [Candidatus Taylorbacteria bacterium RIFCSPLOWO2_01_FULL_45_34b]|nr:MAG: hypothetical protein A3A22_02080 [Candidatus Taylorbacteria bacterium RIFCSPLOWO2_01_FULL_45_34b]
MSRDQTIKIRQGKLKRLLVEQMKRTPTIEQSCQKVGVTRMTVFRWTTASKRFAQEVDDALREGREFVSDIAETQMFSLISQGKSEMIKYFLSHNNARYRDRLELSGTVNTKDEPLTETQKKLIRQALQLSSLRKHGQEKQQKKVTGENPEGQEN